MPGKIKKNNRSKGFTLLESLVAISIFTMLMMGITLMLKDVFYIFNQQNLTMDSADRARMASFTFTNEVRNAAYGNDGSYPLNQASTSQIIFFSTYGAVSGNINRIRYYLSNSTLYKGVMVPTGNPLDYNSSETISTVLTGIASTTVFSYYDGNYAGTSTPLSQPVNLNNVKYVQINLVITNQDVRNATTTYQISSGTVMRNLKINLGN